MSFWKCLPFWQFHQCPISPLCNTFRPAWLFFEPPPKVRCVVLLFDLWRGRLPIPLWFVPESGPVGSPMRSNSANDAKILSTNRPCGVVVSIEFVRLLRPTPRFSNSATRSSRFFRERPNHRASGAVKLVNTGYIIFSNSGRSALTPDAFS